MSDVVVMVNVAASVKFLRSSMTTAVAVTLPLYVGLQDFIGSTLSTQRTTSTYVRLSSFVSSFFLYRNIRSCVLCAE